MSDRPQTVADCLPHLSESGPWHVCPWVGCRKHLALTVSSNGRLLLNSALLSPDHDLVDDGSRPCCQVDVVMRRGASTLEAVGASLGVVRERVRQVEERAIDALRENRILIEVSEPLSASQIEDHRAQALAEAALPAAQPDEPPPYLPTTPWADLPRGYRLRRLRQRLGWTATQVCSSLEISRSSLYYAEQDVAGSIPTHVCGAVMDFLGIPLTELDHARQPSLRRRRRADRAPIGRGGSIMRLDYLLGIQGLHGVSWALRAERVRRLHALTQRQMATRLGVSSNYYGRLERGISQPSKALATRLFVVDDQLAQEAA